MEMQKSKHLGVDRALSIESVCFFRILLTHCLIVVLGTGCQAAFHDADLQQNPRFDHPAYTLGPGDKIQVTVYEQENLSGTFSVDDAGTISLPLIRRISVKGLTLSEMKQAVTKHLLNNNISDPKVSIGLIELRRFCVFGEVRTPGCYAYVHGLTGSKAIAMAGGYSYRAKKNELVITREDGRKMAGDHNTPVFGGDVIEVLERFFW